NIRVNSFTMKMEILLEPASNKLVVEHAEFDESNENVVERFYTSARNPVKEILLKLNLPDHKILKDGGEVNGSPTHEFKMEKELCQEVLLSPSLFIIAMEALQSMVIDACNKKIFFGLNLSSDGSNISLLQYADDALFFEACEVERVAQASHCKQDCLPFSYLGLPVGNDMSKVANWVDVIEWFYRRLSSWKSKSLSIGGRLTLTKMKKDARRRLDGKEFLSLFKKGGLGTGNIRAKNHALLGKWWWRFNSESDVLWCKFIKCLCGEDGVYFRPQGQE
ncbi:hypothetical protein Tco_1107237, partial [Tanacetum coccineum]